MAQMLKISGYKITQIYKWLILNQISKIQISPNLDETPLAQPNRVLTRQVL